MNTTSSLPRHQPLWWRADFHSMRSPPPGHGPGAATAAHDTAAHTGPLSPRAALKCAVTTLLTSTSAGAMRFACSINFLCAARRRAHHVDMPHMRSHGVRAADEHALHGARWASDGADLDCTRLTQRRVSASLARRFTLRRHTDTVAAVFTCQHCNAVPERVVDGKATIAVVRHKLNCPTLMAQTRTRWPG
jgi:hypothetical protein